MQTSKLVTTLAPGPPAISRVSPTWSLCPWVIRMWVVPSTSLSRSPWKAGLPVKNGSIRTPLSAKSRRKAEWPNQVIFMSTSPRSRCVLIRSIRTHERDRFQEGEKPLHSANGAPHQCRSDAFPAADRRAIRPGSDDGQGDGRRGPRRSARSRQRGPPPRHRPRREDHRPRLVGCRTQHRHAARDHAPDRSRPTRSASAPSSALRGRRPWWSACRSTWTARKDRARRRHARSRAT